ncbi:hypothetical protein SAMN02910398_02342 [Butyrivibrio sp. YAB3001]|nr:hypothetical protein SAMN02910398_02342 [Butyrivibrio sp. YAB3001]
MEKTKKIRFLDGTMLKIIEVAILCFLSGTSYSAIFDKTVTFLRLKSSFFSDSKPIFSPIYDRIISRR